VFEILLLANERFESSLEEGIENHRNANGWVETCPLEEIGDFAFHLYFEKSGLSWKEITSECRNTLYLFFLLFHYACSIPPLHRWVQARVGAHHCPLPLLHDA